ncbi:MAG: hypothetical protein JXR70_02060 [Spirochaetales bacterium]|nr:hypothetical protein [Spirochaetales bacterium]
MKHLSFNAIALFEHRGNIDMPVLLGVFCFIIIKEYVFQTLPGGVDF